MVCGAQKMVKVALESRPGGKILFCFKELKLSKCLKFQKLWDV